MSSFTSKKVKNTTDEPLAVTLVPPSSTTPNDPEVFEHALDSKNVPSSHDNIITTGSYLISAIIDYSSFGYAEFEVGIWDGVDFTKFYTKRTTPDSPGDQFEADLGTVLGDGTEAVRVIVTGKVNNNNVATTSIRLTEQTEAP